jgi:nicotinamide-nucleotide amidase
MNQERSLLDQIAEKATQQKTLIVTAESCTGGLVAERCTSAPDSSVWFCCSFVTYRLEAKTQMLGVPASMLDRYGAVSEPVARAMAIGALERSPANLSVSITGIAGPGGGDPLIPVGTVWFGWAERTHQNQIELIQTVRKQLHGTRHEIRQLASDVALEGILEILNR